MIEVVLLILIALIAFIIYKLWVISAKQSITFSALVTNFLKTNTGDALFVLILVSSFAEALLAMSLKDEHTPTEARILLHISMFLFGIVGTTMLSRTFPDSAKAIRTKKYSLLLANVLVLIPGSIFLAFGGPIVNLMVILKLGGDTSHAIILIAKLQYWLGMISYNKLNYIITSLDYNPITYNIFALSSANAQASLFLVGAHFIAVLANVIYTYTEKLSKPKAKVIPIESTKEENKDKAEETKTDEGKKTYSKSYTMQNLEKILSFLNYPESEKAKTLELLSNKINQFANPQLEEVGKTVSIANTISELTYEIESFSGNAEEKRKLADKIINSFRKPFDEGGLSTVLRYFN